MADSISQENRLFSFDSPLGDKLLCNAFSGTEALSELFHFNLELVSEDFNIGWKELLNRNVTVGIRQKDDSFRYFNGFIIRFEPVKHQGRLGYYKAEMVPWLWFLTQSQNCAVHQKKSVVEVMKIIFDQFGFSGQYDLGSLADRHAKWINCCQYRETAYDFISRLAEIEGIYYYFKHEFGKHTLMMVDHRAAHLPLQGQATIPYAHDEGGGALRSEDAIIDSSMRKLVKPSKYAHKDYNFLIPNANLYHEGDVHTEVSGERVLEVYDYPGEYEWPKDAPDWGTLRQQELEYDHAIMTGSSTARAMTPGYRFEMTDHPRQDLDDNYLITSVTHHAHEGSFGAGFDSSPASYDNGFAAIPSKVQYRPTRKTETPNVASIQTATVVGPKGEEIYTDEYGRVKVHFHWDRNDASENSSCWIRVMQPWAGPNWGHIWIPRVGMEVIVQFLEGDPDRPVITGCLYNEENRPPYKLPDRKNWSGVMSRSTKGGKATEFNELRFDDSKGSELYLMHAQKDMQITVNNDTIEAINRDRTLNVKRNQIEQVEGDKHGTVKGNFNEKVGGNLSQKVGGNIAVNASGDIVLKADGNICIIAGGVINLTAGGGITMSGGSGMGGMMGALTSAAGGGLPGLPALPPGLPGGGIAGAAGKAMDAAKAAAGDVGSAAGSAGSAWDAAKQAAQGGSGDSGVAGGGGSAWNAAKQAAGSRAEPYTQTGEGEGGSGDSSGSDAEAAEARETGEEPMGGGGGIGGGLSGLAGSARDPQAMLNQLAGSAPDPSAILSGLAGSAPDPSAILSGLAASAPDPQAIVNELMGGVGGAEAMASALGGDPSGIVNQLTGGAAGGGAANAFAGAAAGAGGLGGAAASALGGGPAGMASGLAGAMGGGLPGGLPGAGGCYISVNAAGIILQGSPMIWLNCGLPAPPGTCTHTPVTPTLPDLSHLAGTSNLGGKADPKVKEMAQAPAPGRGGSGGHGGVGGGGGVAGVMGGSDAGDELMGLLGDDSGMMAEEIGEALEGMVSELTSNPWVNPGSLGGMPGAFGINLPTVPDIPAGTSNLPGKADPASAQMALPAAPGRAGGAGAATGGRGGVAGGPDARQLQTGLPGNDPGTMAEQISKAVQETGGGLTSNPWVNPGSFGGVGGALTPGLPTPAVPDIPTLQDTMRTQQAGQAPPDPKAEREQLPDRADTGSDPKGVA